MHTQKPPRLKRYVRHRFRKPRFQLQERDRQIVRLVAEYRVIASTDIQLLVGGSQQTVLRRLQRLFHGSYLDRPRAQRHVGNAPMVYALGQRGAELLAQETGRRPIADLSEKNRQLRAHYLQHSLLLGRFVTAIRYASESTGTVQLERWCPDGFIRDAVWVNDGRTRERIPICPDGVFVLRIPATGERIHGFVEADRSTMDVPRFLRKLRGYREFQKSGKQQQLIGARNCLVVTITTSEERATNLMRACRSVGNRPRAFLFGSETAFLPVTRGAVFDPIWHTPADSDRHSLLE